MIYLGSQQKCDSTLVSSSYGVKEGDRDDVEGDGEVYDKAVEEEEGNVEVVVEGSGEEGGLEEDGRVVD